MHTKAIAILLAAEGIILCLGGGVCYFFLLDHPWLRSTPVVNIAVMFCGLTSGVLAAFIARRRWATGLALADGVITAVFLLMLYVGFALPSAQAVPVGRPAPDFTLPDQDGRLVSLTDYHASGPVLLVFYRGFW